MFQSLLQSVCTDRRRRDWILFFLGHALIVAVFLAFLAIDARAEGVSSSVQSPWVAIILEAFAPLIVTILVTVAAIVTAIAGFLLRRGLALINVRIDESFARNLNTGFEKAATLALERLGDRLRGGIPVERKGEAVNAVVNYVDQTYPDSIQHFGKTYDELRQMAEIRLNGLLIDPEMEQRVSSVIEAEGS